MFGEVGNIASATENTFLSPCKTTLDWPLSSTLKYRKRTTSRFWNRVQTGANTWWIHKRKKKGSEWSMLQGTHLTTCWSTRWTAVLSFRVRSRLWGKDINIEKLTLCRDGGRGSEAWEGKNWAQRVLMQVQTCLSVTCYAGWCSRWRDNLDAEFLILL
jgi:hypothetical protein